MTTATLIAPEKTEEELLVPVKLDEDDRELLGGLLPPNCSGCWGPTCASCGDMPGSTPS